VASRHTITHEVQNDSLDIRPSERTLDLDGSILIADAVGWAVSPEPGA